MGCINYFILWILNIIPWIPFKDITMNLHKKTIDKREKQTQKLLWMVFIGMIISIFIIYTPCLDASYGGNNGGGDECCIEAYTDPGTKAVYPGDDFTIDVWTDTGNSCPVVTGDYTLEWDPLTLELVDYTYNGGYGPISDTIPMTAEMDGMLRYTIARKVSQNPADSVYGPVLTCLFHTLDASTPGTYEISLDAGFINPDLAYYDCVTVEDCDVTILPEKALGYGECVSLVRYWL